MPAPATLVIVVRFPLATVQTTQRGQATTVVTQLTSAKVKAVNVAGVKTTVI